jgi:hypothetical protein
MHFSRTLGDVLDRLSPMGQGTGRAGQSCARRLPRLEQAHDQVKVSRTKAPSVFTFAVAAYSLIRFPKLLVQDATVWTPKGRSNRRTSAIRCGAGSGDRAASMRRAGQ